MDTQTRNVLPVSLAFLFLAALALLSIIGTTIWLVHRSQLYFNDVIEARDIRSAVVELRNDVQIAESSRRGFLATGNEIYLAPYDTAKLHAEHQLKKLNDLQMRFTEKRAVQRRLSNLLTDKFAEMGQVIELERNRRHEDALAAFRTNRGKALMDEANIFFSSIARQADERLTAGTTEQRANAGLLRLVSMLGGLVIILFVGGVFIALTRYTHDLATAKDEVTRLNVNLEQRVAVRTAALTQANEEIQRFAYIVTHDLRAPLVNIIGFTSELESNVASLQTLIEKSDAGKDLNDPVVKRAHLAATIELPEAISYIRSSTKKMDNLINAILKLSHEGRRKLKDEAVNLQDAIISAQAALQHQLANAEGRIDIDTDIPPFITDKMTLEQIIGNLLDNAIKYRSHQRPLRIAISARAVVGERLAIEVSDNGRGIAAADHERVFDLFRRAGAQDQKGEGIGLAHVRTMVRNLGGEITMQSELERGTTFNIILPVEPIKPWTLET